jgi:hypothetical protein
MSVVLPTGPIAPTRASPKILVLYGMPKVGKTEAVADLPGCLIIDSEGGSEMYNAMRYHIDSVKDLRDLRDAIIAEGGKRAKEGKTGQDLFPYKYIAIDTVDKLEEFAEVTATSKYKLSTIGKTFQGRSVLELPNGGGYYYLRNELKELINEIASVCPRLILITHVKEKLLNKGGEDVKVNDISLTGKLGSIVCAMSDAIGYLYRVQGNPKLMVSFETFESTVMGARAKHLAGQKFEFDWNKIYID